MFVLFANSKMLFASNLFTLSSLYHIHSMIYRVPSEPHVYISVHYRNVQGAAQADDIGTGVPDSRGTLSSHSLSTASTVTHCGSGGRSVEGQKQAVF